AAGRGGALARGRLGLMSAAVLDAPGSAIALGPGHRPARAIGEPLEIRAQPLELLVGALLEVDETGARRPERAQELVELQLRRHRVAVLRVLDQEDGEERDDGRPRVDRELPRVGVAAERPGEEPTDADEQREREGPGRAHRDGAPPGEAPKRDLDR